MMMIRTHVTRSAMLARTYLRVMKPRNLTEYRIPGQTLNSELPENVKTEGTTDHHGTNFMCY